MVPNLWSRPDRGKIGSDDLFRIPFRNFTSTRTIEVRNIGTQVVTMGESLIRSLLRKQVRDSSAKVVSHTIAQQIVVEARPVWESPFKSVSRSSSRFIDLFNGRGICKGRSTIPGRTQFPRASVHSVRWASRAVSLSTHPVNIQPSLVLMR